MYYEKDAIEKIIEKANDEFKRIVESCSDEEKPKLKLFKEKYIHFIVYSLFKKKEMEIISEYPTEWKFKRKGKKKQSGNHDLVLFDRDNNPVAAFEFFLGYDVTEKKGGKIKDRNLDSKKFKEHLEMDYEKLKNSGLTEIYILNYFYKGKSKRAPYNIERKENSYQNHFTKCLFTCEELVKKQKDSGSNIKLEVWVVEARDDGKDSHSVEKFS